MTLRIVPSREHPIYKAFKVLRNIQTNTSEELKLKHLALRLVEEIAIHEYKWDAIVGHMIIMDDTEEMEKEGAQ